MLQTNHMCYRNDIIPITSLRKICTLNFHNTNVIGGAPLTSVLCWADTGSELYTKV